MAFHRILCRYVDFVAWFDKKLSQRECAVGMAVAPPLVYADQAYSIVKKR